jgi:hypothetical protein
MFAMFFVPMVFSVPFVAASFLMPVPFVAVVVVSVAFVFFVAAVVVMVVSVRHGACESLRQGYTSRDFTNSFDFSEFL